MNLLSVKTKSAALVLALLMAVSAVTAASGAFKAEAASATEVQYFLDTVGPMCTVDMRDNHILASLSLAQAIWESGWGTSVLAKEANALFGIRAYNGWDGKIYDRNECVLYDGWDAVYAAKGEAYVKAQTLSFWRAYDSWQESVDDHSDLFNSMSIYANLRGNYDYASCAVLVVQDGYCGVPEYTTVLMNLYGQFDLSKYDCDFSGGAQTGASEQPPEQTEPFAEAKVSLSPKTLFAEAGVSCELGVCVEPAGAPYSLESDNTAVASLSGTVLTTRGDGSCTVTLRCGGASALCHVTVEAGYGCTVADGVYIKCFAAGEQAIVPAEAKTISAGAFEGTKVRNVVVGKNVLSIQEGAFSGIDGLKLFSYGNGFVSSYAAAHAIECVSLTAGWSIDAAALIVSGIPVYTTAAVIGLYYGAEGIEASVSDSSGRALADTDYIGTGSTVKIGGKSYAAVVRGDVNGDGRNTTADLLVIRQYLGGEDKALPARAYRRAADFNCDNRITTADYLAIFKDGE